MKRNNPFKERIVEETYCCENLPQPLFACLKTGKRVPKRGIPPFGRQGRL
jgi:hypothetical protein